MIREARVVTRGGFRCVGFLSTEGASCPSIKRLFHILSALEDTLIDIVTFPSTIAYRIVLYLFTESLAAVSVGLLSEDITEI